MDVGCFGAWAVTMAIRAGDARSRQQESIGKRPAHPLAELLEWGAIGTTHVGPRPCTSTRRTCAKCSPGPSAHCSEHVGPSEVFLDRPVGDQSAMWIVSFSGTQPRFDHDPYLRTSTSEGLDCGSLLVSVDAAETSRAGRSNSTAIAPTTMSPAVTSIARANPSMNAELGSSAQCRAGGSKRVTGGPCVERPERICAVLCAVIAWSCPASVDT